MYLDDDIAMDPNKICDLFVKHFSSVFTPKSSDSSSSCIQAPIVTRTHSETHNTLSMVNITLESVRHELKRLKINKGPGPDGIPPIFFRNCCDSLSLPLSIIYNKSLVSSTFPNLWKTAHVVPIPKTSKLDNIKDYRPISILSCPAKVFESIICPILTWHLKSLLSVTQHGFQSGKSTLTNLVQYTDYLAKAIDTTKQIDAIYTDIGKAFDRVDHGILLAKLDHFGIHGDLLNWLSSYLSSRKQKVVICGHESSCYSAPSGVPQGSHLGPILFLAFINDLPNCLTFSKHLMFADDVKIFRIIENADDSMKLQKDLDNLNNWCKSNKLPLNNSKCKHIKFTKKRHPIETNYNLDETILEEVDEIKDLGITLDKKLSYTHHFDHITKKASKAMGFVWRNSKQFNYVTKIILYKTLVRSHLEYCSTAWNPFYLCHANRIENIQKRFLHLLSRSIGKHSELKHYEDKLKFFKLPSLADRRRFADQVFLFKTINSVNNCPDVLECIDVAIPRPSFRSSTYNFFSRKKYKSETGKHRTLSRITTHNNLLWSEHRLDLFGLSLPIFKRKLLEALDLSWLYKK